MYTFALDADDWARFYVNNDLVVNKWAESTQHYELRQLTEGDYDLRVEFADTLGLAKLTAWWWGPGYEIPHEDRDPNQWYGEYWINTNQWWDAFARRNEGTGDLNKVWGTGSPGWDMPSDNFSTKFRRRVYFDCGRYRFRVNHDDGARLKIDGILKLDQWGSVGTHEVEVDLSQGYHEIELDHYEAGGYANLSLNWTRITSCLPSAPTLISPTNGSIINWDTPVTLKWNAASNATQYYAYIFGSGVNVESGWLASSEWRLGLMQAGTYSWKVKARNEYGESPFSSIWTFSVSQPPPNPPYGLTATIISSNQIDLSWQDGSDNETGFKIYRDSAYLASTSANVTTYQDRNLTGAPYYCYKVTAVNASGESAPSNESCAYLTPTQTPTGVSASDGTFSDRVRVTWNAVDGAKRYEVWRSTSAADNGVKIADPVSTSYDDMTAVVGTTYYYRVRACNIGCTGFSAYDSGYRAVSTPSAPSGVSASDGTYVDRIRITWNASADATYYEVWRSMVATDNGSKIIELSDTTYDDSSVSENVTYYYRIKACNTSGCSNFSAADSGYRASTGCSGAINKWCAAYFNNRSLSGSPVLQRDESAINYDWGSGGPGSGVNTDNFSVRWQGPFTFDANATYEFTATADDGIRLWVDNTLLIDAWRDQAPTTYRASKYLTAGQHTLKVEYYENSGGATAKLSWATQPSTGCSGAINKWCAAYFNNRSLSGSPVLQRDESAINYDWGSGGPGSGVNTDNFSVRWQGPFTFDANATYEFTATADDGIRLWVDNTLLIDAWRDQAPTTYRASKYLTAGQHTLKVEYYENSGGATAKLSWAAQTSPNIALGRPSYASSAESSTYLPRYGNDGNLTTRWASMPDSSDFEYWYVDLGDQKTFDQVVIRWDTAYAAKYYIGWSNDGETYWGYEYSISQPGTYRHNIGTRSGRYAIVIALAMAPNTNNYSFWEYEIYLAGGSSSQESLPMKEPVRISLKDSR